MASSIDGVAPPKPAVNSEKSVEPMPNDHGPGSIGYGPLKSRDDLDAPPDVDAIAERRLGPLWRRMRL